jgi:hypothetical protein
MILCDFDDLNAMGFRFIRLEDHMALSLLGMQGLGLAAIDDNVVNVPSVNQIQCDFFGVLEAEIDLEAGPVVGYVRISHVVAAVEDDEG